MFNLPDSPADLTCVIVGDRRKSFLSITQSIRKRFCSNRTNAIESYQSSIKRHGKRCDLIIHESVCCKTDLIDRRFAYQYADLFLICFNSLDQSHVKNLVMNIRRLNPSVPIVFVGMAELPSDSCQSDPVAGQPGFSERAKLAADLKANAYLECTSLKKKALREIFDEVVLAALGPIKKRKTLKTRGHFQKDSVYMPS